jgi:asparagine synthase (glutamine-hydrolysing)
LAKKPVFPEPFDNDLQNLQYRDLFYTKIPRALRFNDRISMMHSTELREPFLDHRMVELAFSLPREMKIKNGQQKWLARQIAQTYLPGKLSLAPKRPVQTPQREWLAGELKQWGVLKTCEAIEATPSGWFHEEGVALELEQFHNGSSDNSFFVWQWLNMWLLKCENTKNPLFSPITMY